MSAALDRVNALAAFPMEHDGQRVVTLAQVDTVHGRKAGTARSAFRRHKRRMEEGRHFYRIERTTVSQRHGGRGSAGEAVVALTERGYLLLAKAFNDEVAWQVQEKLVDGYFRARATAARLPSDAVLVSRSDLNAILEKQESLIRAVKTATSNGARMLRVWQGLGPEAKALASEPAGQGYIAGVNRLDLLADLKKAQTTEGREKRLGELLAQVVGLVLSADGEATVALGVQ